MKLARLLENTETIAQKGVNGQEIRGITNDSREIKPGDLFVAIKGYKTDGHFFIDEAVKKGAAAVVIENSTYRADNYVWVEVPNARKALADLSAALYDYPSTRLNVIGVTGTNGKTTTTNLIAAVLEEYGHLTGLIGTIHNRVGNKILPVHHTTPEAPELQKLYADFLKEGARYVVMEVSSHALDLYRVHKTEFDIAVFTNLTQDHLDYHVSMEQYLAAKGKLFSGLGVKNKKQRRKFAVINGDDRYAGELAAMTSVPVITYGIKNSGVDVRADNVEIRPEGARFTLKYTNRVVPVSLKITGFFNVYNALAAIAVGLVEGIAVEKIITALEKLPGIPGRFEKVEAGQDFVVIVDYSHTPDSLENCLKTARELCGRNIITVFGCGGDRDRTKRPLMGEIAAKLSDFVVVTSDNPRSEKPEEIITDIMRGVEKTGRLPNCMTISDRRSAISYAIGKAKPNDVVIIAGKGHEDYQIIGKQILPFDDRVAAREAIKDRLRRQ